MEGIGNLFFATGIVQRFRSLPRFLGFNALLHFNAFAWFYFFLHSDAEPTMSVTLFFLNVSLKLTPTLPLTSMRFLACDAFLHSDAKLTSSVALFFFQ